MTYSHIIDVPAPIEFYDVSHAAIREIAGPDGVDGLGSCDVVVGA